MTKNISEIEWTEKDTHGDILRAFHFDLGRITVLDRMTGFGYRETETAFTPKSSALFYLAQGFDIREYPEMSLVDAVELIKEKASEIYE